jgi:hypothetical protein
MSPRTAFPAAALAVLFLTPLGASSAGEKIWEFQSLWSGPRQPIMDLAYGPGTVKHRLFAGVLADAPGAEVKLGYRRNRPEVANVVRLDDRFVIFNYAASDLFGKSTAPTDVRSTLLRFGFGSRHGYGYDFKSTYLFPYSQTSFLWTKLDTKRPADAAAADAAILDRYEGTFRFGATAEGGLAFGLADIAALRVGYEVSALYPRHVFWPALGSAIVAGVGMGAISHFGKDIVEASPAVGPVLYAVLRNAVALGYYLLIRDNQYWPFASETPLTTEALKVGVTLTF